MTDKELKEFNKLCNTIWTLDNWDRYIELHKKYILRYENDRKNRF